MSYDIIAFVLACVAVLGVGALLIALVSTHRHLSAALRIYGNRLSNFELALKGSSSATLAGEVAALDAALAKLAKSVRSQFGSVWGTIGALEESTAAAEPASDGVRPTRDQLRAAYLKPIGAKE